MDTSVQIWDAQEVHTRPGNYTKQRDRKLGDDEKELFQFKFAEQD